MSTAPPRGATPPTHRQQVFLSWASDILIYIVVLNLWVEFAGSVVIDSFWISILTAVLLKGLLTAVVGVEQRIHTRFLDEGDGTADRVIGIGLIWLVLFSSKFLILEVVNVVFGDHVELGGFVEIVGIVVSMMVVSALVERVYVGLGDPAPDQPTTP